MKTRCLLIGASVAGVAVLVGQLNAGGLTCSLGPVPICPSSVGPDVITADLNGIARWGVVGDITAYSIGTTSCNIGDTVLLWDANNSPAGLTHPVIAQNMYRYKDGRIEQIGMSWLKHGFSALTQNLCCTCQNPGNGQRLGIGCSDPYGASLNGSQAGFGTSGGLGPRFEIDAAAGTYVFPYDSQGVSGNFIYKRLQIHNDDLEPDLNAGAKYYGEGHYIATDDTAAGNHDNNVSYEEATLTEPIPGVYNFSLINPTTIGCPAIYAWQVNDPMVKITPVADQNGGRFNLAYRVTDNGDGTWHYEYALHNMNSHQSAGSFSIPIAAGCTVAVTNVGFHDVDYHSGDGEGGVTYDGTDWTSTAGSSDVSWETFETFAENANANALRWGTMYNFRFDADQPPVTATATIGLFRPGTPTEVTVLVQGPSAQPTCLWDCGNFDCVVGIEDLFELFGQWGQIGGTCDFGGDGAGIVDLFEMFGNWGACP